jgi:hypothetical protein
VSLAELRASVTSRPQDRGIVGRTIPRLYTRPLVTGEPGPCECGCALTEATSLGFQAIAFAETVAQVELLPWQRWWLIHALELRPDGSFRFRTIVTLVARQQGKTWLLKILALWAMYLGIARMVLGSAQSLDIARESWQGAVDQAADQPELAAEVANVRQANGEQCLTLINGARYRITASTGKAGRGLSVDLLILDELREHRDWAAWAALSKTTMARPNALTVCISNAGDDKSVVLNQLRDAALPGIARGIEMLEALANGENPQALDDPSDGLALFEWSAPDGCELSDPDGWAQAMPGLGHGTITEAAVRSALATDSPAVFRTELLCQRVPTLDSAIDPAAWKACADRGGSLAPVRSRVALCVDVSPDYAHVTLVGGARLDDGRVRLQLIGYWSGPDALHQAEAAMPELIRKVQPAEFGWFPGGPSAALAPSLRAWRLKFRRTVPKYRKNDLTGVTELVLDNEDEFARMSSGLEKEACQALAAAVSGGRVLQPDSELLNAHIFGATKLRSGDGWRFGRPIDGGQHVDAAYACAGAYYLASLVPDDPPPMRAKVY